MISVVNPDLYCERKYYLFNNPMAQILRYIPCF